MTACFRCFRCGWTAPTGNDGADHVCRNPYAPWVRVGLALEQIDGELRPDELADAETFRNLATWAAAYVDRWRRDADQLETNAALADHPVLWEDGH